MNTVLYSKKDLKKKKVQSHIKETLHLGRNVIFPTETVYGIGAYALNEHGVKGIYTVKGRPSDNPLIMHVSSVEEMKPYIRNIRPYVYDLIREFWPGPLTMVFEKTELVPGFITGGLDTIGIRIPSNEIALQVIKIAGIPICAPSANISGKPSSTELKHVIDDFNNKVDIIIDGGMCNIGLESTVLDVTRDIPVILRPGMITKEMIMSVVGDVLLSSEVKDDEIPKAPGMKYKHYSPKGKLVIVDGDKEEVVTYIKNQIKKHKSSNETVGIIVTSDYKDLMNPDHTCLLGTTEVDIAFNLFGSLREMDYEEIDYIYTLSFTGDYSEAIMNRLIKAANKNIVKV